MTVQTKDLLMDLDRVGPIPLYYQLCKLLEEAIRSGRLPPGARIENEVDLARQLNISRPTIRRAIQELVDKGLLVRRRGVGTRVVKGRINRSVEHTGLFDALTLANRAPSTKVLRCGITHPRAEVLEALALPEAREVLHLVRLRYSDGVPFARLENFLPPKFQDITADELGKHGLYQLLRSRGVIMQVAHQLIGARECTEEEAEMFEQATGSPVLTMQRTFSDQSGMPFEFSTNSYRPDLYSFEMTIVEK